MLYNTIYVLCYARCSLLPFKAVARALNISFPPSPPPPSPSLGRTPRGRWGECRRHAHSCPGLVVGCTTEWSSAPSGPSPRHSWRLCTQMEGTRTPCGVPLCSAAVSDQGNMFGTASPPTEYGGRETHYSLSE